MKRRFGFYFVMSLLLSGCSSQSDRQPVNSGSGAPQTRANAKTSLNATSDPESNEWSGVYSSPSEIGGFSGTVLVIEKKLFNDDLGYRKRFYSDVELADSIEQDTTSGSCLIEGDRIYIPEAYGFYRGGKPVLRASIARYTKVEVNGYVTLMRDDAYNAFKTENKLYDYGILIKVSMESDRLFDLGEVEHKSIKILYDDESKPWKDPFVSGPNER